ncbi:protein disulfide-isomerase A4 [Clonorchis sinensis]|uniref:Protein disulfide-isomerase A4 n=1 Tax=Clonorchis sinensis TaxID=79923 RepID=G7YIH0_CLOSI|nr:protein disulfide-isomerase A4 [Clonorchis sinensis]
MIDTWKLFALLATLCSITESSKVVILTKENMTSFRQLNPLFMLLFSVDWCTHCISMWPEYELAAAELAKLSPPIPLAKVNGMTEESLVKDFNINSYPSIFLMSREIVHPYKGPYRAKEFIEAMKREAAPGYTVVHSLDDIALKRRPDDTVVLALYKSESHPGAFAFFRSAHVVSATAKPMATKSISVRQAFGLTEVEFAALLLSPSRLAGTAQPPVINVTKLYLNDSLDELNLAKQLAREQLPVIGVYSGATNALYDMNEDRLLCVVPYPISLYKEANNALRKLATDISDKVIKPFGDKIHWVIVDDLTHSRYLSKFADPLATDDMVAGCRFGNHKYQMYGNSLSMTELRIFAARTLIKLELDETDKGSSGR